MYVCMYVCKISNNKSFPKIPQDYMHKKPRLQALFK